MVDITAFRMLADVMSRAGLSLRTTFGGLRDFYATFGFKRELTAADYRERFERHPIAFAVVTAYPDATWRGTGDFVIEDEDPDIVTPFENEWNILAKRLSVWAKFKQVDYLAGLGRFSVLLIGAPGKLETELPPSFRADQLLYLTPLMEGDVTIDETQLELDEESPRFGLPKYYTVKRLSGTNRSLSRKVHHSRILHVADNRVDDRLYGRSRLSQVWNDLDNLDKLVCGGAEAFWMTANPGVMFNIDKDMKVGEGELEKLRQEVDNYIHGMSRAIRTRGVEAQTLSSSPAVFLQNVQAVLQLISAGSRIPLRILIGSERGELASTQDRQNWNERVLDRQTSFAGPDIVHPFIDLLIKHKALPKPNEYVVRWPEASSISDTERVENAAKLAKLNTDMGEEVVTADEIRDRVLLWPPLDEVTDEEEGGDVDDDNIARVATLRAVAHRQSNR
jgi:hypothetical protein